MVNSIWYDKEIAINVLTKDRRSFEIKGVVHKAYIAEYFEKIYRKVTEELGCYDLSTVWTIEAKSVEEKTYAKRAEEEEELHPTYRHLDRLLK